MVIPQKWKDFLKKTASFSEGYRRNAAGNKKFSKIK
jgi:hypothetical protein